MKGLQPKDRDGAIEPGAALERLLLGGPRRYTRQEVCDLAGVPLDEARRFWRALGFADVGDDERAFTDQDLAALTRLRDLLASGTVDHGLALRITRAFGHTMSRLGEWQIGEFADRLDGESGYDELERLLPELEPLLLHTWRRQLAAATDRALRWGADEEAAAQLVVGFADLVGFTRLSRRLDAPELAELIETFESRAADVVAELGGRVVKTVGDEVLFVADTPSAGAEIALALAEAMAVEEVVPELRVGVAFGTVLHRLGDVFGSTVNLASRLTSLARPDTVLADRALAESLAGDPAYDTRPIRRRPVRGLGIVEPRVLRRGGRFDRPISLPM
ncbi:MAG: adenylate/guanylate cyclase domain-containing protein [Carbonactinosporaceae bacterium]